MDWEMSITDFLLARITEDEAVARAAIETTVPDKWENSTQTGNYYPADVAFWDSITPARILAECAAKRAIVELHKQSGIRWVGFPRADKQESYCVHDNHSSPCETLRALAAIYADHEDYQQEWSVTP